MKLFIWENAEQVSNNWHHRGGLVVIAPDLAHAVIDANTNEGVKLDLNVDGNPIEFELAGEPSPQVFIFPDAGCC